MNKTGLGKYVNGVHTPLLNSLGNPEAINTIFVDRYSTDEEGGLDSQVARHMSLYPNDPQVSQYLSLIEQGAFVEDPKASVGDLFNEGSPAWISSRDVHHEATDTRPQISLVRLDNKLFVRVSMSAVKREIRRSDGSEENVYTVFLVSLVRACPNLEEVRWAVDVNRAARNGVNWSVLLREHEENRVRMCFGGQSYALEDQGSRVLLSVLGAVGSEDDPVRRRRMLSGQIAKWKDGSFGLGAQFLPYGWDLPRRALGSVPSGAKPIPNLNAGIAMGKFFELFADGKSPRELIQEMANLEALGMIERRAGNLVGLTFQDVLMDRSPLACSKIVSKIVRSVPQSGIPAPDRPTEFAISEYLAGGDPRSIFDVPQQLAIAIMENFRTGVWLRPLKSTIRQKDLQILGFTAVSFGGDASKSYFIIDAPWPWPVDLKTGEVIERFGIPDQVLRRAAVRVLKNLHPANAGPNGGRAHIRAERRAFQNFNEWEIGGSKYMAWATAGSRSGLVNTTVYQQPKDSSRPWSHFKNDPTCFPVATLRQGDLMAAVAQNLAVDIPESLLAQSQSLGSVQVKTSDSEMEIQHSGLLARAERASQDAKECRDAAAGARKLAALRADSGDLEESDVYAQDATKHQKKAIEQELQADAFRQQAKLGAAGLTSSQESDSVEADLSIVAYMAAALTKSLERKRVPASVGTLCDKLFSDWTFEPYSGSDGMPLVRYSVALELPVEGDATVHVSLTGSVKNVYRSKSQGK